jgi:hypothetical protein
MIIEISHSQDALCLWNNRHDKCLFTINFISGEYLTWGGASNWEIYHINIKNKKMSLLQVILLGAVTLYNKNRYKN